MSQLEELETLERELEAVKADINKAEGRLEGAMASLKALNFDTIEEAEEEAEVLQETIASTMAILELQVQQFTEKYHALFADA